MRKIFTFLFAALMSVGMWAEPIVVTWDNSELPRSGNANPFTLEGVTLTCGMNIDWDNKKFLDGGTFTTDLGNFTEIKISADALSIGGEGWSGRTWTGNAASVSYSGEIDGKVYGVTFVFTIEEPAPQPQGVVTLILANLPEENRPATIELAGTFDEGTAELEKLDTGWFIYNFIHASADATGKFRDKTNPNMVLCEFIPANGDEEGKWVQAIFKISDYGYWDEEGWKGTACMWTEIDVTGEQYAWLENAPEPLPLGVENIVLTEKAQKVVVDGAIYIIRDGKIYNVMGTEVK